MCKDDGESTNLRRRRSRHSNNGEQGGARGVTRGGTATTVENNINDESNKSTETASAAAAALQDATSGICNEMDSSSAPQQGRPARRQREVEGLIKLHPTYTLPLLVMIDMFSVSLVVPLLMQYYKDAGVTSSSHRELLSSLFSSSQIIGGLVLAALTDAAILERRTVLLLSFAGSALAYALIVYGSTLGALIFSRILVGLVKQTMTVTTTLLTNCTSPETRALHMGRLNASSTAAWIVGPSVGALLYKNVHAKAPALLAVTMFGLNMILAAVLLPRDELTSQKSHKLNAVHDTTGTTKAKSQVNASQTKFSSFASNLKACFASPALGSAILCLLLFTWFTRATSYASMANYYEHLYDLEPHHRGYLSSYQQFLSFIVQSIVVAPLVSCLHQRTAAIVAALTIAVATLMELHGNLYVYLFLTSPLVSIALSVLALSLKTLITRVAAPPAMGSVLAALDVLQNVTAVTVPFYRTALFSLLLTIPGNNGFSTTSSESGDPHPTTWILSSAVHWFVAAIAMGILLRGKHPTATTTKTSD